MTHPLAARNGGGMGRRPRRLANPEPNRPLHRHRSNCGEELQEFNPETPQRGEFFAGLDLAQTRDYTALAVVERQNDKLFLRHLKIFPATHHLRHRLGLHQSLAGPLGQVRANPRGLHTGRPKLHRRHGKRRHL